MLVRALIFDGYVSDPHWVCRWRHFECAAGRCSRSGSARCGAWGCARKRRISWEPREGGGMIESAGLSR